jgi:hypothetical protein
MQATHRVPSGQQRIEPVKLVITFAPGERQTGILVNHVRRHKCVVQCLLSISASAIS